MCIPLFLSLLLLFVHVASALSFSFCSSHCLLFILLISSLIIFLRLLAHVPSTLTVPLFSHLLSLPLPPSPFSACFHSCSSSPSPTRLPHVFSQGLRGNGPSRVILQTDRQSSPAGLPWLDGLQWRWEGGGGGTSWEMKIGRLMNWRMSRRFSWGRCVREVLMLTSTEWWVCVVIVDLRKKLNVCRKGTKWRTYMQV